MSKYHVHTLAHQEAHWELTDSEWDSLRGGETWVQMRRNRIELRIDRDRSGGMSLQGLGAEANITARKWLVENCTDLYWYDLQQGQGTVFFRSSDDAMHFRMRFHDARHEFD